MSVFDTFPRNDLTYASNSESQFHYLNRSGRPEVYRIRELIENWFAQYPEAEKDRLRRELRSSEDNTFHSAFWELYWYTLLRMQGFHVEVHVAEKESNRNRDFRCSIGSVVFFLEATVVYESVEEQKQSDIRNKIIDHINQHAFVPGFRYDLDITLQGKTFPKLSKITRELRSWVSFFNREDLWEKTQLSGYKDLPTIQLSSGEWSFTFRLIPRSKDEELVEDARSIAIGPMMSRCWNPEDSIRNSLKRKAIHYKQSGFAYFIAINCFFNFPLNNDNEDIIAALYGTPTVIYNPHTQQGCPSRKRNGFWIGPNGPCNRNITGVLYCDRLSPWTVSKSSPILFENPWTRYPIPEGILLFTRVTLNETSQRLITSPGIHARDMLGLSEEWPR